MFEISLPTAPTSESYPMSSISKRTKQVEEDLRASRSSNGLRKSRVKNAEEDSNSVSSNSNSLENADLDDANYMQS